MMRHTRWMTRGHGWLMSMAMLGLTPVTLANAESFCASKPADHSKAESCPYGATQATVDQVHDHRAPEADRKAILAMAGEYQVKFQFQETVAVMPGYELKEPYHSQATEMIEVVEDTGDRIVLQHILVMNADEDGNATTEPRVIKHWRQDWVYEDTELLVYRGHRVFENVKVSPEQARGRWSQAVYQVDDSPRYESLGIWTHTGDRSSWESGETWRPLPRREYTKRSDYHVLVAQNRHTITPAGWVHEQDNHKLVLDEQGNPVQVIAHESGLNVYDKADGIDFAAGRSYWHDTQAYWQDVRAIWADVLDDSATVRVATRVDDRPVFAALFKVAGEVQQAGGYQLAHREQALQLIRQATAKQ